MKKLAIYVEGQCEQLFIKRLLEEIAGKKEISFIIKKATGSKRNRTFTEILAESKNAKYFVLIVNCGNDTSVKSDMRDDHINLLKNGYEKIIGIRDVHPVKHDDMPKLRSGLKSGFSMDKEAILFILAVMEFEAWLISEYSHFARIHPQITVERIKEELDIDVINDDLSLKMEPAKILSDIYWLEKILYDKSSKTIENILSHLDYRHLKTNISQKFEDLKELYQTFEHFFNL